MDFLKTQGEDFTKMEVLGWVAFENSLPPQLQFLFHQGAHQHAFSLLYQDPLFPVGSQIQL